MSKGTVMAATPLYQSAHVFAPVANTWKQVRGVEGWVAYNDHSPEPVVEMAHEFMDLRDSGEQEQSAYVRDDNGHLWELATMRRMSRIRNRILNYAAVSGYDYLLLVDSDVALAPDAVERLYECYNRTVGMKTAAVSPIYWTQWDTRSSILHPQVWDYHPYGFKGVQRERYEELRRPGIHDVRGLGACTLINVKLCARFQINYSPLESLTRMQGIMQGEDRWFCLRAEVNNTYLRALATEVPLAYHIYRDSDVDGIGAWYEAVKVQGEVNAAARI